VSVATDILYPALRLAGVVTAAGRGASVSQRSDAFASLNRMLDSWTQQRLLIYSQGTARYSLTPSQTSYTIGPGADFDAPRPVRITAASIITDGSTHTPLELLTPQDWASKSLREMPTTIPTELYCDYANPIATLYLYGYPTAGGELELWTWQILDQYVSVDSDVSLPPGYLEAVVYQLAVRLSGQFGTVLRPDVFQLAREAKGVIKAFNASPSPAVASADSGTRCGCGGSWNYMTGLP
jgi:hypothetical protein